MVCTVVDELSLQLLEDCQVSWASSTRNRPSQPFLTRFIGHGHFGVAAVCFREWFSFGTDFFSLLQPCVLFFFCCACMCQLPGRRKSDTARCYWQREVNVIRRPLPRTTGRTSECLHTSSSSKCMRDVTEHVGTNNPKIRAWPVHHQCTLLRCGDWKRK